MRAEQSGVTIAQILHACFCQIVRRALCAEEVRAKNKSDVTKILKSWSPGRCLRIQQRSQTLLADVANMCAASTEPLMAEYVEKCDLSKRNQLREKTKKTIGVKNMIHCRALLLHSCSIVER